MERPLFDTRTRDWYSVSVDTLRAWGLVLGLAALVAVGFFGYRFWEHYELERRASAAIAESRSLASRIRAGRADLPEELRGEHAAAVDDLNQASQAFDGGEFPRALDRARSSQQRFGSILEAIGGHRPGVAQAQFLSIQGRVEYRRGDGDWQDARARTALYVGDHVKTGSNGSAEIIFFADGTLYTVRPDTQFVLSRDASTTGAPGEQAIEMDYGYVNLNTHRRGGRVATPDAEARVAGNSQATVTYDAETRTGRFAAYQGSMEVSSSEGEARRVDELEQVVQRSGHLAGPVPLPPAPALLVPDDNLDLELEATPELVLSWQEVADAEGYALQVSRNALFVDNVIDVDGRERPRATLGLRGEGVFHWRVAASAPGGDLGPWSPHRTFRVSAVRRGDPGGDREPPLLELEAIEAYGSIFIVDGRTEPGIGVEINGEPVQVAADGTFTKTIQITTEGWSFIEIRAHDAEGNETALNPRVFVEIL